MSNELVQPSYNATFFRSVKSLAKTRRRTRWISTRQHTRRRLDACMMMDSWTSPPLAAPWPAKHLDLGEVERQGDSGKTFAHFPVALRPNRMLGSAGGAMSKLWAVELMRPHFLWICVLRLDFPVCEDHTSAKEALSVVRVFMASPSASPTTDSSSSL